MGNYVIVKKEMYSVFNKAFDTEDEAREYADTYIAELVKNNPPKYKEGDEVYFMYGNVICKAFINEFKYLISAGGEIVWYYIMPTYNTNSKILENKIFGSLDEIIENLKTFVLDL